MRKQLALRNFFNNQVADFFEDSHFLEPFKLFSDPAAYEGILNGRSDFEETEEAYTVDLEVPGIKKDEIKIDLKENILTVAWSRKRETDKAAKGRYERSEGSFTRRYQVKGANPEQVKAELKDGVLKIEIKKKEEAQVKSIDIN